MKTKKLYNLSLYKHVWLFGLDFDYIVSHVRTKRKKKVQNRTKKGIVKPILPVIPEIDTKVFEWMNSASTNVLEFIHR